MKLNDKILQVHLQDHFRIGEVRLPGHDNRYRGPQLYAPEEKPEAGWVYVTDGSNGFPSAENTPEGVLFVVSGPGKEGIPEHLPCITLEEEPSAGEVLNILIRCFRRYDKWERDMYRIREEGGSVEELLRASLPIFRNPLLVFRSDMSLLASAGTEDLPDLYQVFRIGVENVNLVNSLFQDPEFKGRRAQTECYWGPDYILGFRTLNRNTERGSGVACCVTVMEYKNRIDGSIPSLLTILSRHIRYVLLKDQSRSGGKSDVLHRVFYRILSDRTLDYVEASRQLSSAGWTQDHEYLCLIFRQSFVDQTTLPVSSLCHFVEEQFRDAVSFPYEENVVSFFDITRLDMDKDDIAAGLTHFVRDACLKAGYSRVMGGHMSLRRQYMQAVLALEMGSQSQPYLWIHHFDQIAMDYIMKQITRELPGDMLCHRGILRLQKLDRENGSEYINTLRVYLDRHQNVVHSANALFIHRSTLLYRLDKIREIMDSDLEDPEELLYIELSLRLLDREEALK